MTNQEFCYWLQGYFEISANGTLTEEKIQLIQSVLAKINQPLGQFTSWLVTLLPALEANDYHPPLVTAMTQQIKVELNAIFFHVIDPSYDTEFSSEYLLDVHSGLIN